MRIYMKIKTSVTIIVSFAFFAFEPLSRAQCTPLCDGNNNTALGTVALFSNTTGHDNTAIGAFALTNNTAGYNNTAMGSNSLLFGTTGHDNIAIGFATFDGALGSTGNFNTAIGNSALVYDASGGDNNTAMGSFALQYSSTGQNNTAVGNGAMTGVFPSLSTGSNNTAIGYRALYSYTTGGSNTASGYDALYFNTTGNFNTATGRGALYKNTASDNTAVGYQSLNLNGSGHDNAAFGMRALQNNNNGYSNVALGQFALQSNTSGFNNIAVGGLAGFNITTGSNNIDIGNQGLGFESNVIRIGTPGTHTAALISGIYNVPVSGLGVVIGSSGQLGTTASSARYKENIQPMDKASEAILSLQPVTFRYKKELDPNAIPQFGLVAEQVEKVDSDLVARDDQGKPYSVRYEAVNAMLLNEFLKEHRKVEEQANALRADEGAIVQLKSALAEQRKDFGARIAQQQKQIGELKAGLQNVSARPESSPPLTRAVASN
jgi:trimeric autotransporter adhesin